jgi:hypothetical protein
MPPQTDGQQSRAETGAASFWRILGLALLLSTVTVGTTSGFDALDDYRYSIEDPIDRAGIDTEKRLKDYERTGDTQPITQWLTAYHGEAPSQQVMMTLGEWEAWHRRQFLTLVESLNPKDRRLLFERLRAVGFPGAATR